MARNCRIRKRSKRPHKYLLFLWLNDIFPESEGRETGLDVACGTMSFYPAFRTQHYIGVDLDEDRLREGRDKYPEAIAYTSSIEDMDENIRGDFVICIQTIGVNNYFNADNTMLAIQKLINATNANGILAFNIGPKSLKYEREIKNILSKNFHSFELKHYGSFEKKRPLMLSASLAYIMKWFPFLQTIINDNRRLFVCYNKS